MRRVEILYDDGHTTYGLVDSNPENPSIAIAGIPYDLKTFGMTGATVAVNDPDTLRLLIQHGVKARPTEKQIRITISSTNDFKGRIKAAAKEDGSSATSILVEAGEAWLAKRERKFTKNGPDDEPDEKCKAELIQPARITINVTEDFDERIRLAAVEEKTYISGIIVEAGEAWLKKRERKKAKLT